MSFSEYESRALLTAQLISNLEARINQLEKEGGNLASQSVNQSSSESGPRFALLFETEQEAQDFATREEKWWLFGKTWEGRVEGNKITVKHYSPLSDDEFAAFNKSRESVPSRLCRFDQFYSKQAASFSPAKFGSSAAEPAKKVEKKEEKKPEKKQEKKQEKKEEKKEEKKGGNGGNGAVSVPNDADLATLQKLHQEQGDKIRNLKNSKADKAQIDAEVSILLNIKNKIKELGGDPNAAAAPPPAKSEGKKEEKKEEKKEGEVKKTREELKAEKRAQREQKSSAPKETLTESYGVLPLIRSTSRSTKSYTSVDKLEESLANQKVWIRGRVHNIRDKGPLCFLIIRQRFSTVQAVLMKGKDTPKEMLEFAKAISKESIVDLEGTVVIPKEKIESTTQSGVEISVNKLFVVSKSEIPPIQIEDAARPRALLEAQRKEIEGIDKQLEELQKKIQDGNSDPKLVEEETKLKQKKSEALKYVDVNLDTRLDNRFLDLRTPANQAIFRIQSAVGELFREYLLSKSFVEIHSPKMIGCASEGGAQVFKLQYFQRDAYLAQSPQLYKQMAVTSDFFRVFEIGPVFRAENSNTHRHLCEFVGLDLEMAFNEHYHEVLDVIGDCFIYIFDGISNRFKKELEIIKEQYPFEPIQYSRPTKRITFPEAIALLKEAGVQVADMDDLSTATERELGKIIKKLYNTDFYILDKFPLGVRPFYTMPDPNNPGYSNSYDIFLRGEEIMSGAQRVHDPQLLTQRAKECGVSLDTIKEYVDAFKYGAPPHAGGGIGLERVVMLYLGLPNIRLTSFYPRDPHRIAP